MTESWLSTRKLSSRLKLVKPLFVFWLVVAASLVRGAGGAEAPVDSTPKPIEPRFSMRGGLYTNAVSVELSANSATEVVRYTLDGSEPTGASTQYSSPINISEPTLLKARGFGLGASGSSTATEAYSFIEPDLAAFNSNLPLVILDTFGERVPYGKKIPVAARFVDAKTGRSSLLGSPDFEGLGEINVRWHTSLRYP